MEVKHRLVCHTQVVERSVIVGLDCQRVPPRRHCLRPLAVLSQFDARVHGFFDGGGLRSRQSDLEFIRLCKCQLDNLFDTLVDQSIGVRFQGLRRNLLHFRIKPV